MRLSHHKLNLLHKYKASPAAVYMQAGKPRPNFLQVCKPAIPDAAAATSVTASPGSDTAIPESITISDCTDGRDMADYLRSFPSGHASASMFLALYPIMYLLYSLLARCEVGRGHGKTSRLMWEVRSGLMTCFNGLVFALVRTAATSGPTHCSHRPHPAATCHASSPLPQMPRDDSSGSRIVFLATSRVILAAFCRTTGFPEL